MLEKKQVNVRPRTNQSGDTNWHKQIDSQVNKVDKPEAATSQSTDFSHERRREPFDKDTTLTNVITNIRNVDVGQRSESHNRNNRV